MGKFRHLAVMNKEQKVHRWDIFKRGLGCACPNCGHRGIYKSWFRLHYRCHRCGLLLVRGEGAFLGAMVWNYGLTVFGFLLWFFLLWVAGFIGDLSALLFCGITVLVVPAAVYPLSWSLWLMTYYLVLQHELPSNERKEVPYDEDE